MKPIASIASARSSRTKGTRRTERAAPERQAISSASANAAAAPKLYAQVARRIFDDIVAGKYAPGSLLPTAKAMCKEFAVSRTTLREAYGILIGRGLIEARPKIGTRVRPKDDWSFRDSELLAICRHPRPDEDCRAELLALRQIVEPAAAALVALSDSEAAFKAIADAYEELLRVSQGAGALAAANLNFRAAILKASGNRFLICIGNEVHALLGRHTAAARPNRERFATDSVARYREIFEAIRDRAPERAREQLTLLLCEIEESEELTEVYVASQSVSEIGFGRVSGTPPVESSLATPKTLRRRATI